MGYYSSNIISSDSEALADQRFEAALANMRVGGKVPKLTSAERQILEFCHGRDMRKFLKEEFEKHPIRLDEEGNLIGKNPFDDERYGGRRKNLFDPLYDADRPDGQDGRIERSYIYEI